MVEIVRLTYYLKNVWTKDLFTQDCEQQMVIEESIGNRKDWFFGYVPGMLLSPERIFRNS